MTPARAREQTDRALVSSGTNPLGSAFVAAVRDRGDLTRYDVEMDDTTWLQGSGEVGLGV